MRRNQQESNVINKSRVLVVAFIATLCLVLSTITAVTINGADITANAEQLPAIAAGWEDGNSGG